MVAGMLSRKTGFPATETSSAPSLWKALAALPLILAVAHGPAWAQSTEEADQAAANRKKEEVRKQKAGLMSPKEAAEQKDADIAPDAYQPQGVNLGQFLLLPKMEVDLTRNSNIYATDYDKKSDFIHTYRPEMQLNSRFERHSLTAAARLERKEFEQHSKESVTNGFAQLGGRVDIAERDSLNATVSYVQDHEDRGSLDDVGGLRPTEFHYLTLNTSGVVNTGRLTHTLGFTAVRREWEDTLTSRGMDPSHLRNRDEFELKFREGYEFTPGYSWLGEVAANQRRYMNEMDRNGFRRDSDGLRLGTGIGLDLSELVRGDFLAGYMRQDYDDERLRDPSGYFVKAQFNWMPTKLTTVLPSLERSVEETTANNVSSTIRTSGSVTVRHELERNIILGSTLSYSHETQEGGDLRAHIYEATLRGTYLFDRNLYASLEAGQRQKIANIDGSSFAQTLGMLRLGVQY